LVEEEEEEEEVVVHGLHRYLPRKTHRLAIIAPMNR
jgi:hypothetical protein